MSEEEIYRQRMKRGNRAGVGYFELLTNLTTTKINTIPPITMSKCFNEIRNIIDSWACGFS